MKLAINIKASSLVKHDLLAGLADIIQMLDIAEAADRYKSDYLTLNFHTETNEPDILLQKIGALIAIIEKGDADKTGIDVHVSNIDCSEPALCAAQNKQSYSPVASPRLIPWKSKNLPPDAPHDIFLDPALVFGTGQHPSTRLCLELLKQVTDREKNAPRTVLDIGCGTGILTIAALRLGASRALGIEIDPDAVQVARRNILLNRLSHSAQIIESSWQNITEHYDLILANLVPSVLFKAAPSIAKLLREHGLLITAGFSVSKNKKVIGLFEEIGLHLLSESSLDAWGALLLKK